MSSRLIRLYLLVFGSAWLSSPVSAVESATAVRLIYQEYEQGVEPYQVSYTISGEHMRIDDATDQSGFIVLDYLVIGRPITQAKDPVQKLLTINSEISQL